MPVWCSGALIKEIKREERGTCSFSPSGEYFVCTMGQVGLDTEVYDRDLQLLWHVTARDLHGSIPIEVAWNPCIESQFAIAVRGGGVPVLDCTKDPNVIKREPSLVMSQPSHLLIPFRVRSLPRGLCAALCNPPPPPTPTPPSLPPFFPRSLT